MNTCLFRFLCLWVCVCAVQFLKGLLVLFKDVAILFDHLQLICNLLWRCPLNPSIRYQPWLSLPCCSFLCLQPVPRLPSRDLPYITIKMDPFRNIQAISLRIYIKRKEKFDEDWGHGFTPFKSRAFPQNGSTYAVAVGKSLISAMKAWFNIIIIINHAKY